MIHLRRVDSKVKEGGIKLLQAIEQREFHRHTKENALLPKFVKV